jgi:hypothetical protein
MCFESSSGVPNALRNCGMNRSGAVYLASLIIAQKKKVRAYLVGFG